MDLNLRRLFRLAERRLVVVTVGAALVLASAVASQPVESQPTPLNTVPQATTVSTRPSKVLMVVLENRGISAAKREMPYLMSQGKDYAMASSYWAVTHPSLPNYLVLAGGTTFGVKDSLGPAYHRLTGYSVFGQAIARGRTAKTYAEGMTSNCLRVNTGRYAVRHNPWTYFASPSERARCLKYNVPAGTTTSGNLHRDVAAGQLPNFSMLIPDLCNDGHDCSLATADAWLYKWLRQIKAGPDFRAGRLAVVVTFDEDEKTSGNHVLSVVMHPTRRGVTVSRWFNHYSMSATASSMAGISPLRSATGRPDFLTAFNLR